MLIKESDLETIINFVFRINIGENNVRTFAEVVRQWHHFENWILDKYPDDFEGKQLSVMRKALVDMESGIAAGNEILAQIPKVQVLVPRIHVKENEFNVGDWVNAIPHPGEVDLEQIKDFKFLNGRVECFFKNKVVISFEINVFGIREAVVVRYLKHIYNKDSETHYPTVNTAQWAIGKILNILKLPNVVGNSRVTNQLKKWRQAHNAKQCPALDPVKHLPWVRSEIMTWGEHSGYMFAWMIWAMVIWSIMLMSRCSEITVYCVYVSDIIMPQKEEEYIFE
jgi:hypothetical protein